jgi:hypothetical protein
MPIFCTAKSLLFAQYKIYNTFVAITYNYL